ncbi:MAG TPA: SnoaL-like domain-containing protein, partial [Pseudomonadales bacterium]
MTTQTIAKRLVELCNSGQSEQAVDELYAANIVSIEANGTDEMPARIQGLDAIRKKGEWWYANNEVHGMTASGPFIG